ncbi:hypothetical protein PJL18_04080 [Paenarthrobacter nicotinovorans]|nr:hypothetical protein [Paenarthrobacter nicotinovorans]
MGCQVSDLGAVECGEAIQRAHLVHDVVLNFTGRKAHVPPTETPQVRETRVGPDSNSTSHAFANSRGHNVRIAGMEPACDIGA